MRLHPDFGCIWSSDYMSFYAKIYNYHILNVMQTLRWGGGQAVG